MSGRLAGLHGGPFGQGSTYLPGRRVSGVTSTVGDAAHAAGEGEVLMKLTAIGLAVSLRSG